MLKILDGVHSSPKRLLAAYGDTYVALGHDFLEQAGSASAHPSGSDLAVVHQWEIAIREIPVLLGEVCVGGRPSGCSAAKPISEIQMISNTHGLVRCTTGWYRLGKRAIVMAEDRRGLGLGYSL